MSKYANFDEFNEREVDLIKRERDATEFSKDLIDITDAENPEFKLFYNRLSQLLKNRFPDYANERGIRDFEDWLNVSPEPGDSLEDRRFRIKSKLNQQLPYTYIHLHKMLAALCGWGGFELTLEDFVLSAHLTLETNSQVGAVYELLLSVVPANVLFRVVQYINEETDLQLASFLQTGVRLKIESEDNSAMIARLYSGATLREKVKLHIHSTPLDETPVNSTFSGATLRERVKLHIFPQRVIDEKATLHSGAVLRERVKLHIQGDKNMTPVESEISIRRRVVGATRVKVKVDDE